MTFYARLSKDEEKVLCTRAVCSHVLLRRVMGMEGRRMYPDTVDRGGQGPSPPYARLFMTEGWVYRTSRGAWELTQRSQAAVRRGDEPSYRRPPPQRLLPRRRITRGPATELANEQPLPSRDLGRGEEVGADHEDGTPIVFPELTFNLMGTDRLRGRYITELPANIVCPQCGCVQTLDPKRLGVESTGAEGWVPSSFLGFEAPEPPLEV